MFLLQNKPVQDWTLGRHSLKYYVMLTAVLCALSSCMTFSATRIYDHRKEQRDFAATAAYLNDRIDKSLPEVCTSWYMKGLHGASGRK